MNSLTFNRNGINVDITFSKEENTIWMSQSDIAILFKRDKKTISYHINKMMAQSDDLSSTVLRHETVDKNGKVRIINHYNLDIIKQIGYKIDPFFTDSFVAWVKEELNKLNNEIMPIESNIIRFEEENVVLDVRISPQEFTVWLTQDQMSILFDRDVSIISRHIANIYKEKELEEDRTIAKNATVQIEGGRLVNREVTYYNLDVIISVGYRVTSYRGVVFRRWVTKVLKEYMLKGYVINDKRTLVTNENYINLIHKVNSIDERVIKLEKEKNINLPKYQIINDGVVLDAVIFVTRLIESATKSIVLIDPYIDFVTMTMLNYKKEDVSLLIITSSFHKLDKKVISRFPKLKDTLIHITTNNHARFMVIDDTTFYRFGPSFNHIGNKFDIASKEEDIDIQNIFRHRIITYKSNAISISATFNQ